MFCDTFRNRHISYCTKLVVTLVEIGTRHTVPICGDTCPVGQVAYSTKFVLTRVDMGRCHKVEKASSHTCSVCHQSCQQNYFYTINNFVDTRVKFDKCMVVPFLISHVSIFTDVALYNVYFDGCSQVPHWTIYNVIRISHACALFEKFFFYGAPVQNWFGFSRWNV